MKRLSSATIHRQYNNCEASMGSIVMIWSRGCTRAKKQEVVINDRVKKLIWKSCLWQELLKVLMLSEE